MTTTQGTPPVPHYACAFLVRDNTVLLGLRAPHRKRAPNLWDVIGGLVEPDETVADALIRELKEELGVVATDFTEIGTVALPPDPPWPPALCHMHLVRCWTGGEPAIQDDEHVRIAWFALADALALDLALPDYRDLLRRILTA